MSRFSYNAMTAAKAYLEQLRDLSAATTWAPVVVTQLNDAGEREKVPVFLAGALRLLDEALLIEEQIATLIAGAERPS